MAHAPTLVLRERETAAALRAVRAGGVVIRGPAGIGKTALAKAVGDLLARRGWRVTRLLATNAGRSVPFSAFVPLVRDDGNPLDPISMPWRIVAAVGGEHPARTAGVLVVDDAHLLDEQSAAALLAVVLRGGARVIVTVRSGEPTSDAVAALWRDQGLARIDLGPLDEQGTLELIRRMVGGPVAESTAWELWSRSQGNPLYLTELVRFGLETRRLDLAEGLYWWFGSAEVPPEISELFGRRLDEAGAAAREAVAALAVTEALPAAALTAASSVAGVLDADRLGLFASEPTATGVWVRFAHPLLGAVAARRLTTLERRLMADRLRRLGSHGLGQLSRATLEEDATDTPDVELLCGAAAEVLVADPATAARLAGRAQDLDPGPQACVIRADALAELGEVDEARACLAEAARRVRTDDDRAKVALSESSLALWSGRNPDASDAVLRELAHRTSGVPRDHAVSALAVTALFSGRPDDAVALAETAPGTVRAVAVRSSLAKYGALAVMDDPRAAPARQQFHALAAQGPIRASYVPFAVAIEALTGLLHRGSATAPLSAGVLARWPAAPGDHSVPVPPPLDVGTVGTPRDWALTRGLTVLVAGDPEGAIASLREAVVQQWHGEGLFRSEATAFLACALIESGRLDEARESLARRPIDRVSTLPGLHLWVEGMVAEPAAAVEPLALAVATARGRSCPGLAVEYAVTLARHDPGAALHALAGVTPDEVSELAAARMAAIDALVQGSSSALLDAAEQLLATGLGREALELTRRVQEFGHHRPTAIAAAAERLRRANVAAASSAGLTARERQITAMASQGLQDKDIADALVISVRTVESHLANAYRKLGITSRHQIDVSVL